MGFATTTSKTTKRDLGRTGVATTPIAIRSKISLPKGFEAVVRERLGRQVGYAGTLVERGTVRFEDVNGPRGGVDTLCRIKLVLSGRPSIQVQKQGTNAEEALAATLPALKVFVERTSGKHGLRARRRKGTSGGSPRPAVTDDAGEIIGRRVGRGVDAMDQALARPEKIRRDAYIDTAAPGVSETGRKAGGPATARRNSRASDDRATSALEDSRTKPSRKSTRRSANHGKTSHGKERAAVARTTSASAKAHRAIARRR
ncbi:MAG: hypothetical protein H0T89_32955 [Deltaproteobacteria bacterium]|nr:hypothetical protein [Deltaproteobacteria bacterium]MDQ3295627.1 hypothetical protein [Myxococcota bacterium]